MAQSPIVLGLTTLKLAQQMRVPSCISRNQQIEPVRTRKKGTATIQDRTAMHITEIRLTLNSYMFGQMRTDRLFWSSRFPP